MKLKEFITQTLLDITEAITEAQTKSLLHIAPGTVEGELVRSPSFVKFEVSVSVNTEAGGGISVWSIGDAKTERSSAHVNNISFEVPVYFQAPTERNPKHHSRRSPSGSGEKS